jgi:hypothetical protein
MLATIKTMAVTIAKAKPPAGLRTEEGKAGSSRNTILSSQPALAQQARADKAMRDYADSSRKAGVYMGNAI